MSSIQFNYFANEKGEQIIKKELLDKFGSLYQRDFFKEKEIIIKNVVDFKLLANKTLLTPNKLKEKIREDEDNYISIFNSPIIEYIPSKIRSQNVYVNGRLAYFAGNNFPEFKKEVQSLIRKLKKHCWRDQKWQSWVFETIGDEATVFIPNRVVHLKRYTQVD